MAALLRTAGHSREYLTADHNWLSLPLADSLVRLAMTLVGETDEERWGSGGASTTWTGSRATTRRSYMGGYTMGLGSPRSVFARLPIIESTMYRTAAFELVEMHRARAIVRATPLRSGYMPKWLCSFLRAGLARFPTNWGLPRAVVTESQCAADGAAACIWHKLEEPPVGARVRPLVAGVVTSGLAAVTADGDGWRGPRSPRCR